MTTSPSDSSSPDTLYRVVPMEDWQATLRAGRVPRCRSDQRSGVVHLATPQTVLTTAELYFSADEQPLALELEAAVLAPDLQWAGSEESHGPGLLGDGIPLAAVRACWVLVYAQDGSASLGQRFTRAEASRRLVQTAPADSPYG